MVDKIGRKMVQLVAFVGSAVFLTALFICTRRWVDFSSVLLWVSLLAMNQEEQRGIFKIKKCNRLLLFLYDERRTRQSCENDQEEKAIYDMFAISLELSHSWIQNCFTEPEVVARIFYSALGIHSSIHHGELPLSDL